MEGFTVSPFAGIAQVSGEPISVNILYSKLFKISFNETGLPNRTAWSLSFNEHTGTSASNSIVLYETNGTYPYTLYFPDNYTTYPSYGNVIVNGSLVTESIHFRLLTITLTGSIAPTNAFMFLNGHQQKTIAGVFTLTLAAGQTYSIEVTALGYENFYDNLTITSKSLPTILLNIVLTKTRESAPPPLPLIYVAIIAIIIIALVGALVRLLIVFRRRNEL